MQREQEAGSEQREAPSLSVRDALARLARRADSVWAWYVTGTFRNAATTTAGARWAWTRYLEFIKARYLMNDIMSIYGIEGQKRGTPHVHALLGYEKGLLEPDYRDLKECWFNQHGIARAFPYDRKLGAAYYLSKYIMSDQLLDWDITGEGWRKYAKGE